jgi:Flp pilus assembly pilin Flp
VNDLSLYTDYLKARFGQAEEGVTTVEYGLLVAVLGGAIALALATFGTNLSGWLNGIDLPPT